MFDVYTPDAVKCRKSGIITGLPDAYGRGRIIGDYRRVALYGVDRLIEDKKAQGASLELDALDDAVLRLREEIAEQIRALKELVVMAKAYGFDISQPAMNAREAIQWTYFAYLAAVKEQNGAAMSLGRISNFLDIYIERDIAEGVLDEATAQELIDHFVMKLRIVRFLRTPEYDELFSGDPTWVTESIGGMGAGRPSAGDANRASASCTRWKPRPGAGAEPDRAVVGKPAAGLQGLLRADLDRDLVDPVRERRSDAALLGRRLRHRLLRLRHADRQADAVLRRPRQSRQDAALRHQRRPRRNLAASRSARRWRRSPATCSTSTR